MRLFELFEHLRHWFASMGMDRMKVRIVFVFENEHDARCMQTAIHHDVRDLAPYLYDNPQGRVTSISGYPVSIAYDIEESQASVKTTRVI